MKKFIACLLAGVLSAGVISMTACKLEGTCNQEACKQEESAEEEIKKIPQVPEGVTLAEVAAEDMDGTAKKFNGYRETSKNLRFDSYEHYKRTIYKENDNDVESLDETEEFSSAKFYLINGKNYAEMKTNERSRDVYDNECVIVDTNKFHDDITEERTCTAFLKDKNLGLIIDAHTRQGYEKEFDSSYNLTSEKIYDDKEESYLSMLYLNYEDYAESYSNSGMCLFNGLFQSGIYLPYIYYEDTLYSYGYKSHLNYMNTNDLSYLYLDDDREVIENIEALYNVKMELAEYDFIMQADETKFYINQQFTINLTDKSSGRVRGTIEFKYTQYVDAESDLTESNFKENYIEDSYLRDAAYCGCDEEKVASDFLAGKEVVIETVGGYDTSGLTFDYSEKDHRGHAPYVLFVDNEHSVSVYLAGVSGMNFARVENGKVIINSEGAFEAAKDYAKHLIEAFENPFNLENAKAALVIPAFGGCCVGNLYIPLNLN